MTSDPHALQPPTAPSGQVAQRQQSIPKPPQSPRRHRLWLLRTSGWGVLLCLGLVLIIRDVIVVSQGPTDFCQDYIAAQRVIEGTPVYAPLHCWAGIVHIPTPVEYNSHPPTSVLFFYPLGFLSLVPASMLWGFTCLAAYLASGYLLLREIGWYSLRGSAIFVIGSILWEPFTVATLVENFWQLLTLLLVAAWLLERRRRFGWAGGLLGLASLLKIWPVAFLAGGIIWRRWRLVLACGLIIGGGMTIAVLLLGPQAFVAYWGPVQTNEDLWVPSVVNISLVGTIVRLFVGHTDLPYAISPLIPGINLTQAILWGEMVAGTILLGALGFIWWCRRSSTSEPVTLLSQSLFLSVLLLVFPISWRWGMITILLPIAMILLALRQLPRISTWLLVLLWGGLAPLLLRLSWIEGIAAWLAQYSTSLAFSSFALSTLGLLLFICMQAVLLWRACVGNQPSFHCVKPSADRASMEYRSADVMDTTGEGEKRLP